MFLEYEKACIQLRKAGWIIRMTTASPGGIDVMTLWEKGGKRLITVWFPGRGQWELFGSCTLDLTEYLK